MKNRTVLLPLLLIVFFTIAPFSLCQALPKLNITAFPDGPDYTQPKTWLAKPATATEAVDVFFVYPTVLFNDKDWVMDPTDPKMLLAAQNTLDTQAVVFEGQANIYAPIYRQMNIAGLTLSDTEAAPLQNIIHEDVWRALTHYLKYENNGRPFFLAGHSQGSMILADIMFEHWGSTGAEKQLVAALLLGWSLTPSDLKAHPEVRMCEHPNQTGCVISYNTVAPGRQAVAPTLKADALVVNPLSWNMAEDFVPAQKNIGSVFFNSDAQPKTYPHFTSAQIVNGGLVVQPENVNLVTVKGGHFPRGVYHAFDYSLFFMNLKANIAVRIEAFNR